MPTATPTSIRPLTGAILRRATAAAELTAGQAVYLAAAGALPTTNTAADTARARGIVVADGYGNTTFANGSRVDLVIHGPVGGYASLTPGAPLYTAADPGTLTHTAPTAPGSYLWPLGYAETATVLIVQPGAGAAVAN